MPLGAAFAIARDGGRALIGLGPLTGVPKLLKLRIPSQTREE